MAAPIQGKYLSLTSFRRDGSEVATPVWFVRDNGRLLVVTDAASYKVKRIRRNPEVTIAPCSARGRLLAEPQPAHAELLPDSELPRAEALLTRKYRIDTAIFKPIRAVQSALHIGPRRTKPVVLAITLD
ncbi:MAG TPA: PPOX class F420-dependent oxidoreductase [Gaiellaceae bacterium]|nr:PPOX class F420-dependent oxidoreductase [Gaiellaceae bacterium]